MIHVLQEAVHSWVCNNLGCDPLLGVIVYHLLFCVVVLFVWFFSGV